MSEGGVFRGIASLEQDVRYSNKEKKLMRTMKFPPEFSIKVDMRKVQLDVIKPWISQQITKLLGFEDELLIGYVFGLLEEKHNPDPKALQVNITGFLEADASEFCKELWKLLISAQNSIGGIPPQFLAKKKMDILNRKAESERIKAELAKRGADAANPATKGAPVDEGPKETPEEEQKRVAAELERSLNKLNSKYQKEEDEGVFGKKSRSGSRSKSRSRSRSRSRERKKRSRSRSRERRRRSRSRSRDRSRRSHRSRSRDRSRERRRSRSRERRRSTERSRDRSRDRSRESSKRDERKPREKKRKSDDEAPRESDTSTVDEEKEKMLREKALASLAKSTEN